METGTAIQKGSHLSSKIPHCYLITGVKNIALKIRYYSSFELDKNTSEQYRKQWKWENHVSKTIGTYLYQRETEKQ